MSKFNIGDRVVHHRFGTGTIVEKVRASFMYYLIVFDKESPFLATMNNNNYPAKRCCWYRSLSISHLPEVERS